MLKEMVANNLGVIKQKEIYIKHLQFEKDVLENKLTHLSAKETRKPPNSKENSLRNPDYI